MPSYEWSTTYSSSGSLRWNTTTSGTTLYTVTPTTNDWVSVELRRDWWRGYAESDVIAVRRTPVYTWEQAVDVHRVLNMQGQVVREEPTDFEVLGAITTRTPQQQGRYEVAMARHRTEQAARRERQIRSAEERIVAESRATELLLSMLSPDQVASFVDHGHFDVVGSLGGRYRIETGVSGNILCLARSDGRVIGRICAHPTMHLERLPTPDVMLSQMLALVTDERAFVNVANVHEGRRPAHLARAG